MQNQKYISQFKSLTKQYGICFMAFQDVRNKCQLWDKVTVKHQEVIFFFRKKAAINVINFCKP